MNPTPDLQNESYGPHERNVFDLWLAKSSRPTPLVLYIHGGGFKGGDKDSQDPELLAEYLESGISVAAINYRLSVLNNAPFPAAHLDSARALQFLRHNGQNWNLDPDLVAATGGSAGAGISMWLGYHDDLAEPDSDDPVARQSTRLTCIAVRNGQCSYDPRFAEKIGLGRPSFERHDFFLPFYGLLESEIDMPKAHKLYEQAAAITYASEGDPPTWLGYSRPNGEVTDDTPLGAIVHHPKFGIALKERLDGLGVECVVQYEGQEGVEHVTESQFIRKQFDLAR